MKSVLIMYAFLIPGAAMFVLAKHAKKETLAVILKALCTISVLVTAVTGTALHVDGSTAFIVLITAGLAFGLAGDVAICADFIAGMVLFGLGHICYIAAFLQVSIRTQYAVLLLIVTYSLFLFVLRKKIFPNRKNSESHMHKAATPTSLFRMSQISRPSGEQSGKTLAEYRVPVMIYGFVLLSMLSMAATLPFSSLFGGLLLLLGAVLFVLSDALLAWNSFARYNSLLDSVSLFCYFIAQSLFAVSVFTLV